MVKKISEKTFKEFCNNQTELVKILNHRMTSVEENMQKIALSTKSLSTDVGWLKKLLWAILGTAITILISILIKSAFGI